MRYLFGGGGPSEAVGTDPETVALSITEHRATLTLRRPPLNILDVATLEAFRTRLGEAAARPDLRVLVLRAEGKAFSAGVDIADHTADRVERMILAVHGAIDGLLTFPAPVVAAVHGACLGGGLELALACDLAYAAEGATFGQPEIEVGVYPPFAIAALPRIVGERRAREITLLGRRFTAAEAKAWGLVNDAFPVAEFPAAVEKILATLESHSAAVSRLAKRAFGEASRRPFDDAWTEIDRIYLEELMKLDDAREGLQAFLEKRAPRWRDR